MSADRWSTCPQCQKDRTAEIARKTAEVDATYGKIPVDKWKEMDLAARQFASELLRQTFREDYCFFFDQMSITADYSGGCSVCGLTVNFQHTHLIGLK